MSVEHSPAPLRQFLSDLWNKVFGKYVDRHTSIVWYLNAHSSRSQLPWDENWKLDEKFFTDMHGWKDRHPDSTMLKVMERINDAVAKNLPFAELVPDTPFPARGLVKALAHLLALGVVCPLFFYCLQRYLMFLCKESSKSEERGI